MSQENVEIVRAGFEAWNAGDMDAWADSLAPDVISRPPEGWPEPGPFIGKEAVVRQFMQLRDTWDADALEAISGYRRRRRPNCREVHLAWRRPRPSSRTWS